MSFVQLIRFTTHDIAAVRRINEEWRAATDGARTLQSQCLYVDHADPSRYVVAAEFESAEAAAANSALPQTQRAAAI